MKLSEILGWKKNDDCKFHELECDSPELNLMTGWNKCYASCDREIDREALENHIRNALCDCKEDPSTGERSQCRFCYDIKGYEKDLADAIISTMPQWMKGVKNEAK